MTSSVGYQMSGMGVWYGKARGVMQWQMDGGVLVAAVFWWEWLDCCSACKCRL